MAPSIALVLAYRGTAFSGFARQKSARTVQHELENALETIAGCPVETICAGRTDAGVHAVGQVVSCHLPSGVLQDCCGTIRSLNALTPSDMAVRMLQHVPDTFNARFDALAREYRYRIAQGDTPPLFMEPYCWYLPSRLDIEAMREAARFLIGEHDFASFCVARSAQELHTRNLSTYRTITDITLDLETVFGESMLTITVCGNAFLHSMVRTMVGTLVEVGRNKHDPRWVGEVLAACDRTQAGQRAPAQGLVFQAVRYPSGVFDSA